VTNEETLKTLRGHK